MYYIVGLGNPGKEYADTRHNIGWSILDAVARKFRFPEAIMSKSLSGKTTDGKVAGVSVSLLYPETFMNNSGSAVVKFVPPESYKKMVVLYDDVDLPLGTVRLSFGRGDGGHNGIKSIVEKTGTKDFIRVRIGIAKPTFWPWQKEVIKRPQGGVAMERFVLGRFSKFERSKIEAVEEQVAEMLTVVVQYGYVTAMNRFN